MILTLQLFCAVGICMAGEFFWSARMGACSFVGGDFEWLL